MFVLYLSRLKDVFTLPLVYSPGSRLSAPVFLRILFVVRLSVSLSGRVCDRSYSHIFALFNQSLKVLKKCGQSLINSNIHGRLKPLIALSDPCLKPGVSCSYQMMSRKTSRVIVRLESPQCSRERRTNWDGHKRQ